MAHFIQRFFQLMLGGEFDHFLVAALSPQAVEPALETLRKEGFALQDEDLRHRSGCSGHQEVCLCESHDQESSLARLLDKMTTLTEEGRYCQQYREELRKGHDILAVRVADGGQAERAASLLACHGGHQMHYYSGWTVRDMSAQGMTCPI